ncbi:methanogenic corrinoid protein MtbC1 [Hydrogenophaga palleronii]|uniref:Methanogenic corrinoid protein MtbC1 n=1 Tax=Hydrogenophaga palleronii TaxID=65655 RepID=A0ABU1WLA9_9BURK|nr:MerR family transcriptional regulator [Hydrogenophaga palleronii]MDR7150023.1 methanogenic corrinoid protein MtbC1 [Hydrogenophaga palleronii]
MTSTASFTAPLHTIADVERDTGLSKDTLRVWERRYGFPNPVRDGQGERRYDDAQLHRLRTIRRLLDAGHRPGRVVSLGVEALADLDSNTQPLPQWIQTPDDVPMRSVPTQVQTHATSFPEASEWMALLRAQDAHALRLALTQSLLERGLARFVIDRVAPMNVLVGQAWADGQLAVFEEHLYTEILQVVLRHAMVQVGGGRPGASPRVLLTTLPGEPHGLGLLMAECFMVLEGCQTVPLGTQTPLSDIVRAAQTGAADIVALSCTANQNPREVRVAFAQLRERLPARVEIWAGGRCPAIQRASRVAHPGVGTAQPAFWPLSRLEEIAGAVARWRTRVLPV